MEYFFLGLGNPNGYEGTHHNIGKDLVVSLVTQCIGQWQQIGHVRIAPISLGQHCIVCAVTDGFMNETGSDARDILSEVDTKRLVIIHDDVDLSVGTLRLSRNKNSGGHKGVDSIIQEIKTTDFSRLRIGVGKSTNTKEHVLEKMSAETTQHIAEKLKTSLPDLLDELLAQPSNL